MKAAAAKEKNAPGVRGNDRRARSWTARCTVNVVTCGIRHSSLYCEVGAIGKDYPYSGGHEATGIGSP